MNRRLIKLLIVLGVVVCLRYLISMGLAHWHYSSTPTMREWVKEQPVEGPIWDN